MTVDQAAQIIDLLETLVAGLKVCTFFVIWLVIVVTLHLAGKEESDGNPTVP